MCPCPTLCSSAGQVESKNCLITIYLLFKCFQCVSESTFAVLSCCALPLFASSVLQPYLTSTHSLCTGNACLQGRKCQLCVDTGRRSEGEGRTKVWLSPFAILYLALWGLNYLPGWNVNPNILIPDSQETPQQAKVHTCFHDHAQFVFLRLPKQACRLVKSPVEMFRKLAVCTRNTLLVNKGDALQWIACVHACESGSRWTSIV